MPWHVDLGNDRDEPLGRVGDESRVVVLRVEAARAAADLGRAAELRELRPRVDLDAPPLVVGQVQMQVVELEQRELVEVVLDLLHGEEVAGDIEHRAAVGEAGVVFDRDVGHRAVGGAELVEGLQGVERTGGIGCGDEDAVGPDLEAVPSAGSDGSSAVSTGASGAVPSPHAVDTGAGIRAGCWSNVGSVLVHAAVSSTTAAVRIATPRIHRVCQDS